MGWRFRRSVRFGPVRLNITGKGLSSVSLGGRGATINMPVARAGGVRATVGIPGSGISYSEQAPAQRRPAQVANAYRRERFSVLQGGAGAPAAVAPSPKAVPWPVRYWGHLAVAGVLGAGLVAVLANGAPPQPPVPAQREQQYKQWAKANGVEHIASDRVNLLTGLRPSCQVVIDSLQLELRLAMPISAKEDLCALYAANNKLPVSQQRSRDEVLGVFLLDRCVPTPQGNCYALPGHNPNPARR